MSVEPSKKEFIVNSFLSLIRDYPSKTQKEILNAISERFQSEFLSPEKIKIPVSVFSEKLGAFESICLYLIKEMGMNASEVSKITERTLSSVENSYSSALKKDNSPLDTTEEVYFVPVSVILNKTTGIQEAIVAYLHDYYRLRFNQISLMLKRNYQTIRTAYVNYERKVGKNE